MGFADEVKSKAETVGGKAEDALDTAKDKAEAFGDKAEDALDAAQEKISDVLDDLKKTFDTDGDGETSFAEVVETVKTKAGDLFEDAKNKISSDQGSGEAAASPTAAASTPPAEELVEDFAAAGPAVPETVSEANDDQSLDAVQEEAEELERKSQPGIL